MHEEFVNDDSGSDYELDRGSFGAEESNAPESNLSTEEPYEDRAPEDEEASQQNDGEVGS